MRRILKKYYVYILTNRHHKVLYIGITNNIQRRVWEHKNKLIPGFTKKYNTNKLVYCALFANPYQAITYEKKLKGWRRSKKISLITKANPRWEEIAI